MRCPRPWRARNATRFSSRVPSTIASEGSPNGVFTRISRVFVNPFIAYNPLPPMMPIAACALDLALFGFLAFFAAIFIFSPSREGRSSSEFRSPRKMDPSFEPQLPPPAPPGEFRRPPLPGRARATATRAFQSIGFSNARRVFAGADRSIQNVFEIYPPCPPIPQFPCSPKPLCAPLGVASRHAASPVTASQAVAVPTAPLPHDRPCSKQKCPQSPSARPSYSECHRQAPAQALPARNPPAARCRFHLGQRQPSRSAHVFFRLRPAAAPLRPSLARARQGIPAWPLSG